jgi:hypothetical protein
MEELQCRGLWPLCEGLKHGGSSVEEGVEQPARVPSGLYLLVMEWMATITGDRVGYPKFLGFWGGEKFWRTVFCMAETENLSNNCLHFKACYSIRVSLLL